MVYHICPFDQNFVNIAIAMFESVKKGENRCIIVLSQNQLIKRTLIDEKYIEYIGPVCNKVKEIINSNTCTGIVVHTLNKDILNLVLTIQKGTPIFWRSWGVDLHDLIYTKIEPHYKITKRIIIKNKYRIDLYSYSIFQAIYYLLSYKYLKNQHYKKSKITFLRRVNLISTTTEHEFSLLNTYVKGINAKFIRYNYLPIGYDAITKSTQSIIGNNIMVGHSSFSYHNHLDIFDKIKNYSFKDSKILCPLSYGDELYKQIVIKKGQFLFNEIFYPVTKLISFEEYQKLISNCSSFILNSKVQQGGGNIISFIRMGGKVYLPEENPFYLEFKKLGITLFNIETELTESHLFSYNLNYYEKINNSKIINNIYNEKADINAINQIYECFNYKS